MEQKTPPLKLVTLRRRSGRDFLGLYLGVLALAAGLWAAGFLGLVPSVPAPVFLGAGLAVLLVGWGFAALARRTRTYRLYQDSLEVEVGLVSRRIENLQLFRVRDVTLRQGVLDRLLNVGDVIVASTDTTSPRLAIEGIDDPRGLYSKLRELVAASQAEKRTMIMEGGG